MHKKMFSLLAVSVSLIIAMLSAPAVLATSPDYPLTNFVRINVPGATYTMAIGINNFGQIVGQYTSPSSPTFTNAYGGVNQYSDYLLSGGIFKTINGPSDTCTAGAVTINDFGQIVGNGPEYSWGICSGWTFNLVTSTYAWLPADPNALGTSAWVIENIPQTTTAASGINDAGLIVGYYEHTSGSGSSGFLLSGFPGQSPAFTEVDYPGAQSTWCIGINNFGQIVGFYNDYSPSTPYSGFLYTRGTFITVDYPGAQATCCQGINDFGQVVGYYWDAAGNVHGFLRNPNGSFVTIDYPGATSTSASGINDLGKIVGWYTDVSGNTHGFSVCYR